jgi:hypothetical protein
VISDIKFCLPDHEPLFSWIERPAIRVQHQRILVVGFGHYGANRAKQGRSFPSERVPVQWSGNAEKFERVGLVSREVNDGGGA